MEREELINEKNRLFNRLRNEMSEQANKSEILFWIFCVSSVLYLIFVVSDYFAEPFDIRDTIYFITVFVTTSVLLFYNTTLNKKVAKTDNAQDFLAVYNKYNKVRNWLFIAFFTTLLVTKAVWIGFSKDDLINNVLLVGIITLLFLGVFFSRQRKDIKRLRELVQETSQNNNR